MENNKMLIGKSNVEKSFMLPRMGNRHGLVTGATGTGKTVTLQVLAEAFSDRGVPVILLDVKGDLTGLAEPGKAHPKIDERLDFIGIDDYEFKSYPVVPWDIFGENGIPIRTTVSEMGPLILGRLLDLNDTQQGVLEILFKMADEENLLLLDLKDLNSVLGHAYENDKAISKEYGLVAKQSISAIQRKVSRLSIQGGDLFFGEPALDLFDLLKTDSDGRGKIQLISGQELFENPMAYSAMLLWMISEFYENMPEVGDLEKPQAVIFIDEAHILFDEAGKFLLQRMEQVVKLIRSKGIGLYFITQNPKDIPEDIMSQLGNRIQHALRAYTPKERRALKAAADSFRENPNIDAMEVIPQLGVGEALVSFLDEKGIPAPVDRVLIRPPQSKIGPASSDTVSALLSKKTNLEKYKTPYDRESAYEVLESRMPMASEEKQIKKKGRKEKNIGMELFEAAGKSAVRSLSSKMGREIARGLLGTFFKK
ncbi:MAG TPA: helicase HerA-like domain-containing protein [Clostridia bacterium]|nr:helicase HerA-like domain-containing protein [Clostridia bacterium]